MADIPDNIVDRRIKNVMEGYGQLYHSEVRGKVAPGLGDILYQKLPYLACQDRKISRF
jgi:hypothetical protein